MPKALAIVFDHVISSELKISITRKLVQKLYWVLLAQKVYGFEDIGAARRKQISP